MRPLLFLCLIACGSKTTDGPRWSSTTYDGWVPTPPRDTEDDPDGPDPAPTDTGEPPSACLGEGPMVVQVGLGGQSAFQAYGAGDDLQIARNPDTNQWGIALEIAAEGLETAEPVNAVMRIDGGPVDTTYLGLLLMQCNPPLPDWDTVRVDFESEDQALAGSGGLDGTLIDMSLTLTDHLDRSVELDLALRLSGP